MSCSLVFCSLPEEVLTTFGLDLSCCTIFGTLPSRVELEIFLLFCMLLLSFFLKSTWRVRLLCSSWLLSLEEESLLSCYLLLMTLWWAYLTYSFDFYK